MILEKIEDDEHYYNIVGNDNLHLCMYRVIFGSRLVIHPNDGFSIWGSYCFAEDTANLIRVYAIFYGWLKMQDDLEYVHRICNTLQNAEKRRPWGNDPEFMKQVESLAEVWAK
jgi:hypothetical protein